jgi:ABC-2 type transport system permease protein
VSAWFIATGVFGALLILNGSLVAAAMVIREKEQGTVEQLLMTLASALETGIAIGTFTSTWPGRPTRHS